MSNYHIPVMLDECMEGLAIRSNGTYVDVTFGGGGHSREILRRLDKGSLIAFDQDEDAVINIPEDTRFVLARHNFRFLYRFLKYYQALPVDGLLADLGISSHHIDEAERGFAHRWDAPLDMRMNQSAPLSAYTVVNEYDKDMLTGVLRQYGELKNAYRIASELISARASSPIKTTGELRKLLTPLAQRGQENKFYSQVFQAIRMEVNGEIDALRQMLEQSAMVIRKGGRLVVMSYHSLEDRLVKNYMSTGSFEGEKETDLYGNVNRPFKPLSKAITASPEEVTQNPRSRSAKLRIAEKL